MNLKGIRVLVVEDEPIIAFGLKRCLEELEYEVAGILESGKEAIAFIQVQHVDLILMDINLPEMDGITAMEQISKEKSIPIIFITGYSDSELIQRARSQNTYGYLIKPVDVSDLKAAIDVALCRFGEYQKIQTQLVKAKNDLVTRKLIERAKGLLMDSFGMSEAKAMRYLQEKSRSTNRKMEDIAKRLIETAEKMNK